MLRRMKRGTIVVDKVFFRENPDNEIIQVKPKWTVKKTILVIIAAILLAAGIFGAVIVVKAVADFYRYEPKESLATERKAIERKGRRKVDEWIMANDPAARVQSLKVYEPYDSKRSIWNAVSGEMKKDGRVISYMYLLETDQMLFGEAPENFRTLIYESLLENFLPGTEEENVRFEEWNPSCLFYMSVVTWYMGYKGESASFTEKVEISHMLPALLDRDTVDGFIAGKNIYGFLLEGSIVLTGVSSLEEDLGIICDASDSVSLPAISLRWLYDTGVDAKIELYNQDKTERWTIRKILGNDEYLHTVVIEMWKADTAGDTDSRTYTKRGKRTYELDRNGDMTLKIVSVEE